MNNSEEFARHTIKLFIVSTLRSIDDEGAASCAVLETLVDIAQQYLIEVGRVSTENQELAGRAKGAFFDAQQAINKLGGYSVSHLLETVRLGVPVAMRRRVNSFPAHAMSELPASLDIREDEPEPHEAHVAPWFPSFPQRHTYIHTESQMEALEPQEVVKRKRDTRERLTGYIAELHKRSRSQEQVAVNADAAIDAEQHEAAPLPPYAVQNPYVQTAGPYEPSKDPRVRVQLEIDQEYSDAHGREVQERRVAVVVQHEGASLERRDKEAYAGVMKAERLISSDHTKGLATSEADI